MDFFCNAIVSVYSTECLRYPTACDLERLLTVGVKQGFPGMLDHSTVCIGSGRTAHPAGQDSSKEKKR
jgi:hypothetical protein